MGRLSPQQLRFLDLLRSKKVGDILDKQEILDATGWKPSSFRTHIGKNAYSSFIEKLSPTQYRVIASTEDIDAEALHEAGTQVRPRRRRLHEDDELSGRAGIYRLAKFLGAGAVGHVWQSTNVLDGSDVAIKVLMPRDDLLVAAKLPDLSRRFYIEARNGIKLDHEAVIKYLDYGNHEGLPFLVMQLASKSLGSILKEQKTIHLSESITVIRSCLHALSYLHDLGSVHRDVKPDNILVADKRYVLGDLGIVKWDDLNPAFTSAAVTTRDSLRLGTLSYMAPEQMRRPASASAASDIYSLGVCWLEMLTGSTSTPADIAAQSFPDPCEDREIMSMIREMLAHQPSERPMGPDLIKELGSLC